MLFVSSLALGLYTMVYPQSLPKEAQCKKSAKESLGIHYHEACMTSLLNLYFKWGFSSLTNTLSSGEG